MNTDKLLSKLDKVRPHGNRAWMACCPAHPDKNPSMRIADKGDRILIHCYAGCCPRSILAALGMTYDDLFESKGNWTPQYNLRERTLDEARMVISMAQNKRDSGEKLTNAELQEEREAIMRMKSEYARREE